MAERRIKFWDNRVHIGDAMKSSHNKLSVEIVTREGVKYVNIRGMYKKKRDASWGYEMSGCSVPIAVPMDGKVVSPARDLANLIMEALSKADDVALVDEDNAVWKIKND